MNNSIHAFWRAVLFGTLTGGVPFLPLTIPFSFLLIADGKVLNAAIAALLPLLVAGPVVLSAMLLIALPLTALLQWAGKERKAFYAGLGAFSGVAFPAATYALLSEHWEVASMLLPGILIGPFSGAVAGSTWGKWREAVALELAEAPVEPRPDRGERWLR